MQFHVLPCSLRMADLRASLLAWEGRQRDRPALRCLPLARLFFHLPKARQGPTQQAGEELARTGVPSPAWAPLWYFCSWRLLVASKNPLLSNPSTTLSSSLLKSRLLCTPHHIHSHTCTHSHAHTRWATLPIPSVVRRAQIGRGHLPPRAPRRQCLGHCPLSRGVEGATGVLGFGLQDLTFCLHTPRGQLAPRGPAFSGLIHLTAPSTRALWPKAPEILKTGESCKPKGWDAVW